MSKLLHDQISFSPNISQWEQFGIRENPIAINRVATDFKAITRNNKFVAFVSEHYKVLPNEKAVEIADKAASLAGFKPFTQFSGDWYNRMDSHTILDRKENAVHSLYCKNQSYDVNGEKMYLGVGVHNSIDGKNAFGAGVFTFRHACSNMVLAGTRGWKMEFDQRKTIECVYIKHMGPDFETLLSNLSDTILSVFDKANYLLAWYKEMYYQEATKQLMEKVKNKFPLKLQPVYIKDPAQTYLTDKPRTQWELYNDLTQKIWHNPKTDITSKVSQFGVLHKIFHTELSAPTVKN